MTETDKGGGERRTEQKYNGHEQTVRAISAQENIILT